MLFQSPARSISGNGSCRQLTEEAARLGAAKALLVMDPFLANSGFAEKTQAMLSQAGVQSLVFSRIIPDPPLDVPEEAAAMARNFGAQAVVAVGGGSTLDIAKVAAVLATGKVTVRDILGSNKVPGPGLPTVMIPTTAGTGSEVTNIAILSDEEAGLKVGVVSPYLIAHTVLLDAELTTGLPPAGTAASGIDALIHAMEAYTCIHANEHSDLYAVKAMELIGANLRPAWARGDDIRAREAMLNGAFYAGLAFSNSGCAAVHAFAYPIGARFHIPHGLANAIMLLPVLEVNLPARQERYAHIAALLGEDVRRLAPRHAAEKLLGALESLFVDLRVPSRLGEYGVKEADVPGLADAVMEVTRLLDNNPRRITLEDARQIYARAL